MKILRYLKTILICVFPIIYYHIFYMCRYAKHPEKYPFEKRYKVVRKEIRFVLNRLHVNYKIDNLDEFTNLNEKCLILSNHLSDIDPVALIAASEKPLTFVCKKEVLKFPFVGKVAKAIECFPLDRQNLMNQISQIRDIVSYLKNPDKPSVLIFIEGTRNKNPGNKCLEFHPGTLKIAQMAGVPLLCGSIYGSFRILDKKSYLPKFPLFFHFFRKLEVSEVKSYQTTELAPLLEKETNDSVNFQRGLDRDYVNNLKTCKKRKALETRFDVNPNS